MKNIANIFKALSDPNRVRILKMLERKQLCVCEVTSILQLAPSTVSKHLSILREAGFITEVKSGKWVEHKINRESDNLVVSQLLALLPVWENDNEDVLNDLSRLEGADRKFICTN